jgi:hypothetical protein
MRCSGDVMNNLAIRPATIFLLASVSAFGKYLRTPLSGAPRRYQPRQAFRWLMFLSGLCQK